MSRVTWIAALARRRVLPLFALRMLLAALLCTLLAAAIYADADAQPAAWRIADETTRGELLLIGSVHYLREQDHPLPALIDQLYAEADVIVMELAPEELDPIRAQIPLLTAATLPAGDLLGDVLSPEVYALAEQRAGQIGVTLSLLERFKPWMVALTFMEIERVRQGYRTDLGVEQYLLRMAQEDGKQVLGLESLETQIQVFDGLSTTEQEGLLAQTLRELDSVPETMDALVAAWREGRLDALADELLVELQDFPQLRDALITARNAAWAPRLERLLSDGRRHLIVVGALHLVGDDNVIDLLAARGRPAVRIAGAEAGTR